MNIRKQPWVIYDVDSCHIYDTSPAKNGATRKMTAIKAKYNDRNIAMAARNMFDANIDHDIQVKNLMNGALVTIKASERGSCCDPSTEVYWSM